jgi:hypothetical protein
MTQEYLDLQDDMKRVKQLRTAYDKACNNYLNELLKMWELDGHYGYWNSDRPGTIYHYGETHNLSMEDIIYCVEYSISEDTVLAWEDHLLDAAEFGFSLPNLNAWCHGCPRVDEATFKRLRQMKCDLEAAVDEEMARQRNTAAK